MSSKVKALLPAALLLPAVAAATPNFPAALRAELGLAAEPPCSLCHQGTPQVGTVVTPFGTSMRERGLVLYDEESLRAALGALGEQGVDSDGDGSADLDELAQGGDPNVAPPVGPKPEPEEPTLLEPRYGCSTSGDAAAGWLLLALLGVALRGRVRTAVDSAPGKRCALE